MTTSKRKEANRRRRRRRSRRRNRQTQKNKSSGKDKEKAKKKISDERAQAEAASDHDDPDTQAMFDKLVSADGIVTQISMVLAINKDEDVAVFFDLPTGIKQEGDESRNMFRTKFQEISKDGKVITFDDLSAWMSSR